MFKISKKMFLTIDDLTIDELKFMLFLSEYSLEESVNFDYKDVNRITNKINGDKEYYKHLIDNKWFDDMIYKATFNDYDFTIEFKKYECMTMNYLGSSKGNISEKVFLSDGSLISKLSLTIYLYLSSLLHSRVKEDIFTINQLKWVTGNNNTKKLKVALTKAIILLNTVYNNIFSVTIDEDVIKIRRI